jgi:hypothetical protein
MTIRAIVALLAVALVVAGCSPGSPRCAPLPLKPAAAASLERATEAIDFAPLAPCVPLRGVEVTAVTLDHPAGAPRVTFTAGAERTALLFSQSRSLVRFRQIPDGAIRLSMEHGGVLASGFQEESPGGVMLYLQWEAGGVVFEAQVMAGGRFTVALARETLRTNLARSVEATTNAD